MRQGNRRRTRLRCKIRRSREFDNPPPPEAGWRGACCSVDDLSGVVRSGGDVF